MPENAITPETPDLEVQNLEGLEAPDWWDVAVGVAIGIGIGVAAT